MRNEMFYFTPVHCCTEKESGISLCDSNNAFKIEQDIIIQNCNSTVCDETQNLNDTDLMQCVGLHVVLKAI